MQLRLAVEAFDLVLEAVDDLVAVEAQVLGVAAHEADGIGRPGQVLVLAALYGIEVGVADAQHLGDGPEVLAELLARTDQGVGNPFAGQFLRDENLSRTLGMHQLRLTEPGLLTLMVALLQGVCHGISHLPDLELCLAAATAVKRRPRRTFGALDSALSAWAAQGAVLGPAHDPLTNF